jgi:hypothetical protein
MWVQVWFYREGFARFTKNRYSSAKEDIGNSFIHLTNHAIQKKDTDYDASQTDLKWPLGSLKAFMTTLHGAAAVNQCFLGIQNLVINALVAVQVCWGLVFVPAG